MAYVGLKLATSLIPLKSQCLLNYVLCMFLTCPNLQKQLKTYWRTQCLLDIMILKE